VKATVQVRERTVRCGTISNLWRRRKEKKEKHSVITVGK